MDENVEYSALNSIDAIRIRPGMYIGETSNPNQLITEIIDNSFDEIGNGYANLFSITFDAANNAFWVSDNGRGIKVFEMLDAHGKMRDSIELLCTDTHTGSKFDNSSHDVLMGMNGVGLVVVNALSDWLIVKTRDREDKKIVYEYQFIIDEDSNKQLIKTTYIDENIKSWSTVVGFKPNSNYFESDKFDLKQIVERIKLGQSKFLNADFYFNDKLLPKKPFDEYVKTFLNIKDDFVVLSNTITKSYKVDIYINYINSTYTNIFGDVNLKHCEGTYLNKFQTMMKSCIANKLGKYVDGINPNYLLNGMNCYITLTVPEPKYDSQSKVRMILKVNDLFDPIERQINSFLTQDVLNIIQTNLEKILKKKLITSANRSTTTISASNKLRDCIKTPGDILYIVEGESALGPLKQIRNIETEAIYPLRGKVLNVEKATIEKISKNTEITQLIEACGSTINRRYKKIKIICDADSVSAETLIYYIDNYGYIQRCMIKDLTNFENCYVKSFNKITQKDELKLILDVIAHNYDKKEIWRITTSGNIYEDYTNDHVIYVWDSINKRIIEKSPTNIDVKNDYFIIPKKQLTVDFKKNINININNQTIIITEDLSYLIGQVINHVFITNNEIIFLYHDEEHKKQLVEIFKRLNYNNYLITDSSICLYENEFKLILNYFDLIDNKYIPTIFFSANESIRLALLKGICKSSIIDKTVYPKLFLDNPLLESDVLFMIRQFDGLFIEFVNDLIDINNDFYAIKIRSVKLVPYHYDKVYDLSIQDNQNFPIGPNGIIIHNSDGEHIAVLVILLIHRFLKDYIINGNLSIILPPLYGVNIKGKTKLIYEQSELEQYYGKYEITRFKGLGEMNPSQLELVIRSNMEYVLTYPETEKSLNTVLNVITDSDLKRAILKKPEFTLKTLLNKVITQNKC